MTNPDPSKEPAPPAGDILDRVAPASGEPHLHPETALRALMADRHHRIQVAAYFLAERRGFAPGHALDDWLAAEDAIEMEDAGWAADD
jgi:hypothetical protein